MIARPTTLAATVAAALALAACGGDEGNERLSKADFSKQVNPVVQRISSEFGAVFAELGRAEEDDRVPADVRSRLGDAARVERGAAADLAGIEPPEQAQPAFEKLERGAGRQADRLEEMAGRRDLTVGEMADAMEGGETADALRELAAGGYVDPPPHR